MKIFLQFTGKYDAWLDNEISNGNFVGVIRNSSYIVNAYYKPSDEVMEGVLEAKEIKQVFIVLQKKSFNNEDFVLET